MSVGTSGASFVTSPDATSDDAIYGLIDGAKKTLKLSQQDLVSMTLGVPDDYKEFHEQTRQHASSELLDHLGAAIKRGVKVQIVLSDGGEGGYQNRPVKDVIKDGKLEKGTETYIREHLAAMGIDPNTPNLEVRGLVGLDGSNARNHAKFIMADDEAFYGGSQNVYPGGMADRKKDEGFVALAEFGQIHLDPAKAAEMNERYWAPIWQRSKNLERNHRLRASSNGARSFSSM
jgi:phosphatidylserine/phosphatidylglycerophosphate/cardiolipin synthase-like enzyme